MKRLFALVLLCAPIVACNGVQRDPVFTVFLNYRIPNLPANAATVSQVAKEIEDGDRSFDDAQLQPADRCTLRIDGSVEVVPEEFSSSTPSGKKPAIMGGLFEARVLGNLDSGTFQAALTRADGVCPLSIRKIEITLDQGALKDAMGTSLLRAEIKEGTATLVDSSGNKWSSRNEYFRFTLQQASATRCKGKFEFVARKAGDLRLVLAEGSFSVVHHQAKIGWIP